MSAAIDFLNSWYSHSTEPHGEQINCHMNDIVIKSQLWSYG